MATALQTERLVLRPFGQQDFDHFVTEMLTDQRVVEFYYSFRDEVNVDRIQQQAKDDFWDRFEDSRANHIEERIEAYGSDNMELNRFRPTDAVVL